MTTVFASVAREGAAIYPRSEGLACLEKASNRKITLTKTICKSSLRLDTIIA